MVKYILILGAFICSTIVFGQDDETTGLPFDSVEFSFGEISYQNKPYTGTLYDRYADGGNKASANVVNGKYNGSVRTFYPGGQTHFTLRFDDGEAKGTLRVYYPNGEMKLQVNLGGTAREGGSNLKNITYWVYYQSNYKQKFKGSGRIMFLTKEGLTCSALGDMPANKIYAFGIYDNKLKNNGKFIANSALMYYPF